MHAIAIMKANQEQPMDVHMQDRGHDHALPGGSHRQGASP
jgi:hypothetical protein